MDNIPVMSCIKSTEYSIHTRRCFITGEYCSQQTNIQKEREKLHAGGDINAFVVMNFSSVSDVVYAARIKPFIEELSKYLYLDKENKRIACTSSGKMAHISDLGAAIFEKAEENPEAFCTDLKGYVTEESYPEIDGLQAKWAENAQQDTRRKALEALFGKLKWKPDREDAYFEVNFKDSPWKKVRKIHVHRADSNPVSNYIICSRICQQMQMADLIIVDVSAESANVFYEFGLATAFRKLILPICFSDSFFARKLPEKLEKAILAQQEALARKIRRETGKRESLEEIAAQAIADSDLKLLERHIDCFPWRRKLFEHFGLRFQEAPKDPFRKSMGEMDVHYLDPAIALSEKFGFSDFKYARFPYDTTIRDCNEKIGIRVYNWLRNSYNRPQNADAGLPGSFDHGTIRAEDFVYKLSVKKIGGQNQRRRQSCRQKLQRPYKGAGGNEQSYDERMFANQQIHPACNNTLVVYTMDRFMNEEEAGLCIINFYNNITKPMLEKHCFCGDRVAILGQSNRIWDDPKDGKINNILRYSVSDLIRIGMNQATYSAERRRIKTGDYLNPDAWAQWQDTAGKEAAKKDIKTHIRNRCIPLNPENPIYITQLDHGIQQKIPQDIVAEISKEAAGKAHSFFCLYHVMLYTLRYVNEVVVDLSSNSVQSMFWLGAAHGSDVYAVTVRQEMTEKEKAWSGADVIIKDRPIFDIGGLWTAMLHYDEIDGFYKQLELIQQGIDQHARLRLPETELEDYEYEVFRQLYHASPYLKYGGDGLTGQNLPDNVDLPEEEVKRLIRNVRGNDRINAIQKEIAEKSRAESLALESYYRDRFWRQLLRDNQLHLFLNLIQRNDGDGPKRLVSEWDMDTVAELSHYLSKRKVIGRYQFDTLEKGKAYKEDARKENFVSIGAEPKPLCSDEEKEKAYSLAAYINSHTDLNEQVREMYIWPPKQESGGDQKNTPEKSTDCQYEYRYFCRNGEGWYGTQYRNHTCVKCGKDECRIETKRIVKHNCQQCAKQVGEDCAAARQIFQPISDAAAVYKAGKKTEDDSENAKVVSAASETEVAVVDKGYVLPAQLLLWREAQKADKEPNSRIEYKYHVSLIGVSGPATKALTALLVDDEQKWHIWGNEADALKGDIEKNLKRYLPLNTLQTHIRKKFYSEFMGEFGQSASSDQRKAADYAIGFLSTILPQYFLPFLSQADEKRIYNAMEAFLQTVSSGKDATKITEVVLAKLDELLSGFRGVEALYKVQVDVAQPEQDTEQNGGKASANTTDNRSILNIELLRNEKGDKEPVISCLFL